MAAKLIVLAMLALLVLPMWMGIARVRRIGRHDREP